ncbi:unnamed protein product [Ilex paraguariensis]|uniref:GTD-binding domain-containing protein n=1 Tax=Ilex paraguariensis TaxID=185542 RepID=A0ABC8SUK9_9AQUA
MDFESPPPSTSLVNCCDCECGCSMMNRSYSGTWLRTMKRKFDEYEESNACVIPGLSSSHVARVEIGNECIVLREMVSSQQQTIVDLSIELEEERNAASSAANEAMSMILRLQREKAEIQMESRQFKRFAEEKMAHDQQEFFALEDFLYKREQAIQSLTCEVQAYKHRLMSYGFTEAEAEGGERGGMSRNNSVVENLDGQFDFPSYDYPPLKCKVNETLVYSEVDNGDVDVEKYAFGETPRSLKDLEYRINQLERSPRHIQPDGDLLGAKHMLEKVIVGQSPRRPRHCRRFSTDSCVSPFVTVRETGSFFDTDSPTHLAASTKKMEYTQTEDCSNLKKADNTSEVGDDTSDRIYTIDSVHNGAYSGIAEPKAFVGIGDDYMTTPRESLNYVNVEDPEITKLYMRLQALEADRESMRQAIISVRTDKAQLVLLREMAQHLCKEMSPARSMPVRKPSLIGSFSFMSIFKEIIGLAGVLLLLGEDIVEGPLLLLDRVLCFLEKESTAKQVHVWAIFQQGGITNAFRQGNSCGAVEMSFKYASVKSADRGILLRFSSA